MRKFTAILALCVIALCLTACSSAASNQHLLLLTGEESGAYYTYGKEIATSLSGQMKSINVTAATSESEAVNARALNKKQADLALISSGTLDYAIRGIDGSSDDVQRTNISAIAALYKENGESVVLVCRKDLTEDTVYFATKALYEGKSKMVHEKAAQLDVAEALNGINVPFHSGAEKYYREVGIIK